jgi:5-methyltetrahydrofolate--homocysteine methyltransferase
MGSRFLHELSRRTLVIDGAMGTSIYSKNLSVEHDYCGCENCTDILVRTRPDVIQEIHESFLAVGADAVETDTFGASRLVLSEFDLTPECYSLNKKAAEVARAACEKYATKDKPRFVLGSMGPGTKLLTLGNTTWDIMFESYLEQARGLIDGGADAFLIETCQDILQVKCAINSVLEALKRKGKTPLDIPIMVSVTIETTGTMLLGTEISAAAHALAQFPICSLGLNCATGPTEMAEHVGWLGKNWSNLGDGRWGIPNRARRALELGHLPRLVSVVPNAGLPVLVEGRTEYPLGAQPFAEEIGKFIERDGLGIVGGCCGTTPGHIAALVKRVEETKRNTPSPARGLATSPRGLGEGGERRREEPSPGPFLGGRGGGEEKPTPQPPPSGRGSEDAAVTSLYSPQEYRQDNSILIVGERMNSSGSRAFKKLLEVEDWDGIVSLAREQVRHDGAHVLDLNVDYAGRDNVKDMEEIVKRVVRQVNIPLMLDSTQMKTIEAGLKLAGGKCIINSANFEDGEEKFDHACELAKKYGAALVIGSIDEDKEASMARTADRKLAIASRGYERAVEFHGMAAEDIMFDPLVLPVSTGMESDRRSAIETIEGVRRIMAAFPRCQTTVGLSNCSFGLKPAARVVLNSAFLHELSAAGLTSAIIHFSKILPKNKIPDAQWNAAMDVIHDRRDVSKGPAGDPLNRFIELFKDVEGTGTAKKEKKVLTLEEQLRAHIIDGEKEGLVTTLEAARGKYSPLLIINDHLLDGMKTVGELFGSGQMQLPFVLQSAEVMKMAVSHLEQYMEKAQGQTKGRIVLATVKGDVHDIGKNLVDIILTNNGYTVVNLGIKQPIAEIIKAWQEHKADAIGMSGLLVKSVNVMEENLKELSLLPVKPRVILGGAALTRHYCEGHLRGGYAGDVFYGKDAFDGLRTMDFIVDNNTAELKKEIEERQGKRSKAEELIVATRAEKLARANDGIGTTTLSRARSDVSTTIPLPKAPFWGSRVVDGISVQDVYPFINPIALFRGQWQVKKGAMSDAEYEALLEDKITPIFERLKADCAERKILTPKVVYGYFPVNSDGEDLIVWDPASITGGKPTRELERFTFPRQSDKRRLCISDYFRPRESGEVDVLGMHCVTVGSRASEEAQKLFAANDYVNYLYLHGLGVETAEALAEFWHKRMRQELGIAGEDSPRVKELFTQHYRGSRYSFGYPACPAMSDQEKLFKLLDPARIGCHLTENWQIDPEQSTSAIVVHHPEAKYFNV